MRVEIYSQNEVTILQKAAELKISPTQLVNLILESVDVEPKLVVSRVKISVQKQIVTKKDGADGRFSSFVNSWKQEG